MKATTKKIESANQNRLWQSLTLIALILMSVGFYVYLINQVVFHAVNKKDFNRKINFLTSEITTLESKILAMENGITIDSAYQRGFVDSTSQAAYTFATGTNPTLVSFLGYAREE